MTRELSIDEHAQLVVAPKPEGRYYEPGDPWELRFTTDEGEVYGVELSPRALHELYIEVKDIGADARQAGHSAACALCGEQVDLDRAIPDGQGEPTHRDCWADAYGAPEWFIDYA